MNHSLLCLSYPPAKKAGEKIEERKPSFMQDVKTNPRAHCIKRAFVNPLLDENVTSASTLGRISHNHSSVPTH